MLAAVARRGQLVVEEVEEPVPGPGDALVAVRACGICGSDLHALVHADAMVEMSAIGGAPTPFDPERDFVMGHEFCAEILELGPETDGVAVKAGDLVVSIPVALTSEWHRGGRLLEHLRRRVRGAHAGDGRDLHEGSRRPRCAPCRARRNRWPSGCTRSTSRRSSRATARWCSAADRSASPAIAALSLQGIEPIVAADFSPLRRALAEQMGAHVVVDPADEPAIDAWRRVAGSRPLVIFEAVGVRGMLDAAMRSAPPQSRVVVVGVCMEVDEVRPMVGIVKELSIQFVLGYDPMEFAATLQAIAEGSLDVTPLITASVGVEGVPAAFETLAQPDEQVKILVEPGAPATLTAR